MDWHRSKRILILTYKYTPEVAPRAFRWSSIAKQWVSQGLEVDVICCAWHDLPEFEVIDGVHVHRVRPFLFNLLFSFKRSRAQDSGDPLPGTPAGQAAPAAQKNTPAALLRSAGNLLAKTIRRVYDHLCWPDFGMLWVIPAYRRACRLIRRENHAALVAVSWPVCAHAAGLLVKKRWGRLPFLVDVGDPFSTNLHNPPNNVRLYRRLNRRFEEGLFARADAITITTARTQALYASAFPQHEAKMHVVPPLFTPAQGAGGALFRENGRLKWLFAGSLRRVNRPPDALLALFARLWAAGDGSLELHFIGDHSQCAGILETYLGRYPDHIFVHGVVPHEAAFGSMLQVDVLVNIGNRSDYQVPSKLVDYMATGKPILNLMYIERDTSAEFMRDYPSLYNVEVDAGGQVPRLDGVTGFLSHLPPRLAPARVAEIITPYTPARIAQQYLHLMDLPGAQEGGYG